MKLELLQSFARKLHEKFTLPDTTSPEEQLKEPVGIFLTAFGNDIAIDVSHRGEVHLADHKVRPDIAIYTDRLICGYIELKAPGLGADAPKLKGKHNKAQWTKLKGLPNLIYTDGREWALYRYGTRQGAIIRLDDAPEERGAKAVSAQNTAALDGLLRDFLTWLPNVPHGATSLAEYLAPLTRLLRGEVEMALKRKGSNVSLLAKEWRNYFFPDADDGQFADAYAQTVTYAMLLARLSGAEKLDPVDAAKILDKGNGLLAEALKLLGQEGAKEDLRLGFELLQRSLEALDPYEFLKTKPDLWLYFYEDFLAAYDKKLRNDYGVYYTPREVVELQVRLASEVLEMDFGKTKGFADDGVVFLDPAVGTGTYLVATIRHALQKVEERFGAGMVAARAAEMAQNMYGFEILVGPYAVAHLRLTQTLEGAGAALQERLRIYLADTLESPYATPPGGFTLTYKRLTEEHEAARKVKNKGDILVCLGNPPYDRQHIAEGDETTQRKGGWIRYGDQIKGGAKQEQQGERPILDDFTEPASKVGAGKYVVNLYNDYVYFWRWALWRLFEQQTCGGIVTFITASSYLAGPGFVGMREVMRRTFDKLWILDLGGDSLGTRKTPNVFNIQTPVAIALGMRGATPNSDTPAEVHYAKIEGESRAAKLARLAEIESFSSIDWQECPTDWHAPLLPTQQGAFFDWPSLPDLFPLTLPGAGFYRSWPISESKEVLEQRWLKLVSASKTDKEILLSQSRDRKITHIVNDPHLPGYQESSIFDSTPHTPCPKPQRYGWRSFDQHYALYDFRLGDMIRPTLWQLFSDKQIFITSLTSHALGQGAAMTVTPHIPDKHHFRGSFGGKDVIPLYRDRDARQANITKGLLELLSARYQKPVAAEDLAAYVYALLGGQSYTRRFWNELETPGPRVPLTKDATRFFSAANLGHRLIWLHTYAERFQGKDTTGERGKTVPQGAAKCLKAISNDAANYPESYDYDAEKREIWVGASADESGRFGPVPPALWEFEVSGLRVVPSWLGYRMKVRSGKKSSPLDDIRPIHWSATMTEEFMELLWVLEATLAMENDLATALDRVIKGDCFRSSELPTPTAGERQAPKAPSPSTQDRPDLFSTDGDNEMK